MSRIVVLDPSDPLPAIDEGIYPLSESDRRRHEPVRHVVALDGRGRLAARCSCWWTATPALGTHRVGTLGHYAAASQSAAHEVLDAACGELKTAGCTVAIGPLDGSTWRRYRFIVDRGAEPPFFLEPDNDDAWPEHWRSAGFRTLTTYTSALATSLSVDETKIRTTARRLAERGIAIRTFDPDRADDELQRILALSLEAFQRNFLYTPISDAEFLEQNRRLLPLLMPELVLLAEERGQLVGFLLALPDVLEQKIAGSANTLILKTIAVAPRLTGAGLGGQLIAVALQRASELGFHRAIFALMHEDNTSQRISHRYAQTMRRYALFSKAL
jgi:GNAT superfamily N-acetyltransferase